MTVGEKLVKYHKGTTVFILVLLLMSNWITIPQVFAVNYTVTIVIESVDEAAGAGIRIDGVVYHNNDVMSLSAGTHACEAVTPSGWGWLSWFETANTPVANPSSSSTTFLVNGDGVLGADWGPIITFFNSPSSGGTISVDYWGAATPFTETYSNGESGVFKGYSSNLIANPASDYTFNSWSTTGSMSIGSSTSSTTSWNPTEPGTVTANFQQSQASFSLTVNSESGSPSPGIGSHSYSSGSSITCDVDSPYHSGGTWICTGWTGTGSVPLSGSGTSVTFSITEDSSITWLWEKVPFPLTNGYVTPTSGDTSTTFTYYTTWSFPDTPPLSASVHIDDAEYPMTFYSGSASDGVYSYSTTLSAGEHNYWFSFSIPTMSYLLGWPFSIFEGPMVSSSQSVATPTFSPSPGTYSSAQSVTISCATNDAVIRYTTNGEDPTLSSTLYTGPISISSGTVTIKARAFKSGMTDSDIASGTWTITSSSGPPGTYVEIFWDRDQNYNFDVDVEITDSPEQDAHVLFWAHQFGFVDGNGGYIGLQVVGSQKKAIFSIWDAIGGDPGHMIDEGGSVWSIVVDYDWKLGQKYRLRVWELEVEPNGDEWWLGSVYDYATGTDFVIGKILVPASWGWLTSYSITWTEYAGYADYDSDDIPYTKAVFSGHYERNDVENSSPDNLRASYGSLPSSNSDVDYYGGTRYALEAGDNVLRDTPEGWLVTPEPEPPDQSTLFSVSVSPSSRSVVRGNTIDYTVSVYWSSGSGTVSLSLSGLPSTVGVGSFSQSSSSANSWTSTLTIGTFQAAPPGSYTLTVTGTNDGTSDSASCTLEVNPPSDDYVLSPSPTSRSVTAGGGSESYSITATLERGSPSGVTLSLDNPPNWLSWSFSPTSGSPTFSSTLTVSTSSSAPSGSHTLYVKGSGGGMADHMLAVTLIVNAPPTLSVQVIANPNSFNTDQSSTITVTVTSGGSPVSSASISLSSNGGSLSSTSGTTNSNGQLTAVFSSNTAGAFIISASASKSGYTSGSGNTQVTVTATSSTPQAPISLLSVYPSTQTVGQSIKFDASDSFDPDGQIVSYGFDYGDGSAITLTANSVIYHSYSSSGTYTARVKVVDNSGMETWSLIATITVNPSSTPSTPSSIDSIASKHAKNGETYKIIDVTLGNEPLSVILYYPSRISGPTISDFTGSIVIDSTMTPLDASRDSTAYFIVKSSITLALSKMRSWSAPDPNYWKQLSDLAGASYGSLIVLYTGNQALWIIVDALEGDYRDIALRAIEIGDFVLSQVDVIADLGGSTELVHLTADSIKFLDGVDHFFDAFENVYVSYEVQGLVSPELQEMLDSKAIDHSLDFFATAAYDYAFADDVGGMATTWLIAGQYCTALGAISENMNNIVNSIYSETVTPAQIFALLEYQILHARYALATWQTLENMYQTIVNKGWLNVWYWSLDAPNSLEHYHTLYGNWLDVETDFVKQRIAFHSALDRCYQESIARTTSVSPSVMPTMGYLGMGVLMVAVATKVYSQRLLVKDAVKLMNRRRRLKN